jgi:hypothetical protein
MCYTVNKVNKMIKFFVGLIVGLIAIILGVVLQNSTLVILGFIGVIANIIQLNRKDFSNG